MNFLLLTVRKFNMIIDKLNLGVSVVGMVVMIACGNFAAASFAFVATIYTAQVVFGFGKKYD